MKYKVIVFLLLLSSCSRQQDINLPDNKQQLELSDDQDVHVYISQDNDCSRDDALWLQIMKLKEHISILERHIAVLFNRLYTLENRVIKTP